MVVAGIMTTGARCADIMRWTPSRLQFSTNSYVVDVRVTKNRREPDKRVVHRMADVMDMLGFNVPAALLEIQHFPERSRPFQAWHATRVNQVLGAVCRQLGVARATTYSFRRLYCQLILKYFDYDCEKAKRYTLHCRAEILAAFYDDAQH